MFKFFKKGVNRVNKAFGKTRSFFGDKLKSIISSKIDEETIEKLEELFYEADLGVETSMEIVEKIRALPNRTVEEIVEEIRKDLLETLSLYPNEIKEAPAKEPLVILIVGVNGNGKTSATAKLAKRFHDEGKKVLVGAADTFRAAAIEQLTVWAERIGIDIVKSSIGSDPASVVFDTITAGKARGMDVVIVDTAGRLHTKTDLMHELAKVRRVCDKVQPGSPHETLLIIDSTTGQNAISQAEIFHDFTPMTGVIATKLDSTAKGGILISIQQKLKVPVKFISFGETLDDFAPFDPKEFVDSLVGPEKKL